MERTLDIFRNDAFSQATLRTRVLGTMPWQPTALERMNLFGTPIGIETDIVLIYEEAGRITLIPATGRGSPRPQADRRTGAFKAVQTLRLTKEDHVQAAELNANITNLAFPLQNRMVSAAELVTDRMAQLRRDMQATKSLHMLGAVQGKILDADGTTVIVNFFDMMGIAEPTPVEIDFDATAEKDLAANIQQDFYVPAVRTIQTRNGGNFGDGTGIQLAGFAGDNFWQKIIRHDAVRKIWEAQQVGRSIAMAANPLATPPIWDSIDLGNVRWFHFMGALTGPLRIPTDEAIIFPMNATDVFEQYQSPGETLSTATGKGQELYPLIRVDPRDDPEFIDIILSSYPLYACIYPQILQRATLP